MTKYKIIRKADGSPVVTNMRADSAREAMDAYASWFGPSEGMARTGETEATTRDGIDLIAVRYGR